jgi:hypothetical protein
MHLYHYGSNASMTYQIIDKFIPDLFAEGGQVSLADWNPSTTSDKHLFTDAEIFVGEIEEIAIWKDPIPVSMITQAESLNVKPWTYRGCYCFTSRLHCYWVSTIYSKCFIFAVRHDNSSFLMRFEEYSKTKCIAVECSIVFVR